MNQQRLFPTLDFNKLSLNATNCPSELRISEMIRSHRETADSEESFQSPGSEDLFLDSAKDIDLTQIEAAVLQLQLRKKIVFEKKGEEIKARQNDDRKRMKLKIEKAKKAIKSTKEEGRKFQTRREELQAQREEIVSYSLLYEPVLKALSRGRDTLPGFPNDTNFNVTNANISTASTLPVEGHSLKS